jgi:D-3-phosphoglycerate dehydrogenase
MKMKSNATLINTSRGTLINESDLEDHLKTNLDFNYGSDVFNNEPSTGKSDFEHRLTSLPNVYGTHHIGASTT